MITINSTLRMLRGTPRLTIPLVVCAVFVSGCGPKGQSGSMTTALAAYEKQQYSEAHDQAAAVMAKATSPKREQAAYLAGLSAYQLGNLSAAEQELSVAAASTDASTAGNASVMLGQLRLDQRRPREAATSFGDASRLLTGEDARQAAWHAGLAYREAGDEDAAKRWLDTASSRQFDAQDSAAAAPQTTSKTASGSARTVANPVPPVSREIEAVGFTLQVGAFTDKKRAKRAAEEAEDLAQKESLGRVRIIPRKDARNQPMFLVQIGWWVTRSEAAAARTKIGRLEYIVAPAMPVS